MSVPRSFSSSVLSPLTPGVSGFLRGPESRSLLGGVRSPSGVVVPGKRPRTSPPRVHSPTLVWTVTLPQGSGEGRPDNLGDPRFPSSPDKTSGDSGPSPLRPPRTLPTSEVPTGSWVLNQLGVDENPQSRCDGLPKVPAITGVVESQEGDENDGTTGTPGTREAGDGSRDGVYGPRHSAVLGSSPDVGDHCNLGRSRGGTPRTPMWGSESPGCCSRLQWTRAPLLPWKRRGPGTDLHSGGLGYSSHVRPSPDGTALARGGGRWVPGDFWIRLLGL